MASPPPVVVPTPAEIRAEWPTAPWAEYGFPAPASAEDPDPLGVTLAESVAEFQMYMKGVAPEDMASDPVAPLVRKAIKLLVGYNAGALGNIDTAVDFDLVGSSGVGPISETRRSIGPNASVMHPWPQLDRLLRQVKTGWERTHPPASPGIPTVQSAGPLPKPGEDLMKTRSSRGLEPLLSPGVARSWQGGSGI